MFSLWESKSPQLLGRRLRFLLSGFPLFPFLAQSELGPTLFAGLGGPEIKRVERCKSSSDDSTSSWNFGRRNEGKTQENVASRPRTEKLSCPFYSRPRDDDADAKASMCGATFVPLFWREIISNLWSHQTRKKTFFLLPLLPYELTARRLWPSFCGFHIVPHLDVPSQFTVWL